MVCASSEEGGIVVNGMSNRARDGRHANSALLVGVEPRDFGSDHPLAGMEFQRTWEKAAYMHAISQGGAPYQAPVQTVGSFLGKRHERASSVLDSSYARGVVAGDLHACLPAFVSETIDEALPLLDKKLSGFANDDALMIGIETRSSSPVRIVRDASLQATTCLGVYPCGEGAGYAGGIMSAASDGLRVAEQLALDLQELS